MTIDEEAASALPVRPSTSIDVARRAGVSRSTVSNILNGNDARFPEETRQRVREAASALAYQPSLAGRSLVSGRSDTVVILLPNTTFGTNFQDAVDEVMASVRPIGGNVVVRFAGTDMTAAVDAALQLRPLAIVDFGVLPKNERARLESRDVLVVPRDRSVSQAAPDGGITRLQADALVRRGVRRLWFASLSDSRLDPYGPGRLQALQKYCAESGLAAPSQVSVPLTRDGAMRALDELLIQPEPVGVVCYNDDVAMALLSAARERAVAIPDDLAIVGVDNTAIGQLWSPRLSSIDTDMHGFVEDMADELRARLAGETLPLGPSKQQFRFIEGETS